MHTLYVDKNQVADLEFEVISTSLRVYLTRLLSQKIQGDWEIVHQNKLINKARNLKGYSIYVLEGDHIDGSFHPAEYAWHNGEFELLFRRLNTLEMIEFLGFLLEEKYFPMETVNILLKQEGLSFCFYEKSSNIRVYITPLDGISEAHEESEHVNIRLLVKRMDDALQRDDFAGVLHTSASIFETLGKDIVGRESIQDQTLKGFFDSYRKKSLLPSAILDYILKIYDSRNTTPLAGHGSTRTPQISKEQAIILSEMTRAFVKIEYKVNTVVTRVT